MPIHERRQHFRIDDHIYFDYQVMIPGEFTSNQSVEDQLLGKNGQRYLETAEYFKNIDLELAEMTQILSIKEPALAHYLNLLNSKIDFLSRHLLMTHKIELRQVNISLGGMAFRTAKLIKDNTLLKIIIYTKPQMVPIILDARVCYSQYQSEEHYRTAVTFFNVTPDKEQLLAQHILQGQVKSRAD